MFHRTASSDLETVYGPYKDFQRRVASNSQSNSNLVDIFPFFSNLIKGMARTYDISDDPTNYVFAQVRALHADKVNGNGDQARTSELIQYRPNLGTFVYMSFVGKPHLEEHDATDVRTSHGILVHSTMDLSDPSKPVRVLLAVDKKKDKDYADNLQSGKAFAYSMGCFPEGTPIRMGDGTEIPIKEVSPGDMVLTHMGETREVANTQVRSYEGEMYELTVSGLPEPIRCTSEHPFLVIRPKTVCACGCREPLDKDHREYLRLDQKYETALKPGHSEQEREERKKKLEDTQVLVPEWVKAEDLTPDDLLLFPTPKLREDGDISIGRARLLGYFLAGGSFLKCKGVLSEVEFNLGSHEAETLAKEISDRLELDFGAKAKTYFSTLSRLSSDMCIRASGRELANWFLAHGGQYCDGKRLSTEVLSWPKEAKANLLQAYFLGNGHITPKGSLTATTASYTLSTQLHTLLASLGLFVKRSVVEPDRSQKMRKPIYILDLSAHQVETLNTYLGAHPFVLPEFKQRTTQEFGALDGYTCFKLLQVESEPFSGIVYNFEVDGDNSYVAGGVAVHNCLAQYCQCDYCKNIATTDDEWCDHMRHHKGRYLKGQLMSESMYGVDYEELSRVASPADKGAVRERVLHASDPAMESVRMTLRSVLGNLPRGGGL
jgi:hypothetical protein